MKTEKALIALTLAIILTVPMVMQISHAQTTTHFKPYLFVSVSPNPVGVGQTVYVSLFFDKPIPPVGSEFGGNQYTGLTANIIKPDGTNETLGPYTTDTTGGVGGITFAPATTGNYTFQGVYPGQQFSPTQYLDAVLSPPVTVVVQSAQIGGWSSPPLPTSYWTTPIYASNYGWAQTIGGNWYGLGRLPFDNTGGYTGDLNNYQAYSTAPTTAHILWTLPTTTGGQPSGETAANEMSAYCASSPVYHSFEPVILNGVLYYNVWAAQTDNAGIAAVDLRTGQTLWMKNTTDVLIYGQVVTFHNNEEFGSQAMLYATEGTGYGLMVSSPTTWDILDPVNGNTMATITNVPGSLPSLFSTSPAALIDSNEPATGFYTIGSILIYWLNSTYNQFYTATATSLTMWNSSLCLVNNPSSVPYKPYGANNFAAGIQWSVPVPANDVNYSIAYESNQAILLSSYPQILPTFYNQWGGSSASDIAYSPINGTVLWGPTTQSLPSGDQLTIGAIGDGAYIRYDKDTLQMYGYSLTTGKQLWGPTQLEGDALSHLFQSAAIAYGECFIWDYGGYLNAVNLTTGKLMWSWTRGSAGYNNPYGVYPLWVYDTQSIADGMIFLSEGRLYDPPLFPGAEKLAINCTTGKLVWEINGAFQRDVSPIADGEMVGWNGYDGQIYAIGMGPSKTAVSASGVGVVGTTPVTISGSVTDISAGASQTAVAANFPNGLPCVSDASMTPFMEAVYEQQPMPTNTTGVPVTISVLDSNGNSRVIAKTTTNAMGDFGINWIPDIPGNFTVTATFAGTQSYYGSAATTYCYANAAAATPAPTATPISLTPTYNAIIYGVSAIIVVIIVCVAALAVLMLRKRP